MRIIDTKTLISPLAAAIEKALTNVENSADSLLRRAAQKETEPAAKWALSKLVENNEVAKNTCSFACQDTGLAVVFAEVGQDLRREGRLLSEAIIEGVKLGYGDARKSVAHPLTRLNTHTNTPAIVHTEIVEGDGLKLTYLAKGAGSENMSKIYMLTPSKGRKGIVDSVVDCVKSAGANPCPPVILGIGIGGTMEKAALLSKKALTRESGKPNDNKDIALLEEEILCAVNALGIGAQGLGGDTTALAAAVEVFPTHIGMLPIAVNVQCHSVRHATVIL